MFYTYAVQEAQYVCLFKRITARPRNPTTMLIIQSITKVIQDYNIIAI